MPIRVTCPECDTQFKADDDRAGRRAACPECGERVPVPTDGEPADEPKRPRRRDDDPPKKKGFSPLLIVGIIAGVLLLLCGGGGAAVYFLLIKPGLDAAERLKNELIATAPTLPTSPATPPGPLPPSTAAGEDVIRITATDLTTEFDQDADAAVKKYQGKKLRVNGTTNTSGGGGIELHLKGKPFTQAKGKACYVVGRFEGGNRGAANAVPLRTEAAFVGQFAELKKIASNGSFTIYLKDCKMEK